MFAEKIQSSGISRPLVIVLLIPIVLMVVSVFIHPEYLKVNEEGNRPILTLPFIIFGPLAIYGATFFSWFKYLFSSIRIRTMGMQRDPTQDGCALSMVRFALVAVLYFFAYISLIGQL